MTQPQHELTETGSIVDIEAIYREHYSLFLRFSVATLGDVELGRDAVHEAFVRAIRSLGDFRGEGRPESWLWTILLNVCTAEKRRRVVPIEDPSRLTSVDDPEWPEIRAAIASLPERQKTILFLRHYADLDYEQIGDVLGIARGTVAATLNTAHTKLRAVLGEVKR
ncbi:MAG TPA: sigma-70 family RNA polymerase sigma factor [Gaiellaceae bacterium]|jgi:RNA polymerase sigma-70 factor (ECF subfamily)